MEISTIIFLVLLVIFVITVIYLFNKLVKALNLHRKAFYSVDVALKKRFDLIPNIETIVKKYAENEQTSLSEISEIKAKLKENLSISQRQKIEDKLSGVIKDVFLISENYPGLKEGKNFLELQRGLEKVEEEIEQARIFYNGSTRTYNLLTQSGPTKIMAKLFGFKKAEYFEVDLLTREYIQTNNIDENNTEN